MSFLNKLTFWKKEDEFDFDKELEKETAPAEPDLFAQPQQEPSLPETHPLAPQALMPQKSQDLELLSSKLDTIKAQLSSIEQRLATIERALSVEQKQKLW